MKHLLLTTIAAVVLAGCGEAQSSEPSTAKAPGFSIHEAAENGNIEAVKLHLAAGADVNAKDEEEFTPLLYAAWDGHKEIAELLIANGADVNVKDVNGETPLGWTIFGKYPETADLLRKHGGKTGAELKAEGK